MVRDKPWTVEEKKLKKLVEERQPLKVMAAKLEKSEEAVMKKMKRLRLEVVGSRPRVRTTTSMRLPKELLSSTS